MNRKPGWYWVVFDSPKWECAEWNGDEWHVTNSDLPLHEADAECIGPRIPAPDEPWQCVPKEPTAEMKQACDQDTPGPLTAWKAWQVMLAAAPSPGQEK